MLQVTKPPLFKINGQYLYRDFNIVSIDVPILFVCKNEENNYYLVFLIVFFEESYLVIPISIQNLIRLLGGRITARKPIETAQIIYYVKCNGDCVGDADDIVIEMTLSEIPEEYLPTKDSYLTSLTIENVGDYIAELNEINISKYPLDTKVELYGAAPSHKRITDEYVAEVLNIRFGFSLTEEDMLILHDLGAICIGNPTCLFNFKTCQDLTIKHWNKDMSSNFNLDKNI